MGVFRVVALTAGMACMAAGCGDDSGGGSGGGGGGTNDPCAGTLDSSAAHHGRSMAEWGVEWWRWIYSSPGSSHPGLDADGSDCAVGQDPNSPVFFLAGTFGGPATRTCNVPAGKSILFPILTVAIDNACLAPEEQATPETLRTSTQSWIDAVAPESLYADLDDESIASCAHVQEPLQFSYTVPETDSIYDALGAAGCGGVVDPAFTAGQWIMLEPLEAGTHQLSFGGALTGDLAFVVNVDVTLVAE